MTRARKKTAREEKGEPARGKPARGDTGHGERARVPAAPLRDAQTDDPPFQLLSQDGEWLGGRDDTKLASEQLLALFEGMLRLRLLDQRMLNLQRQGRIGFYGQCTGQEAAIIGSAAALEPRDWVAPALREAGVAVWRGLPLERLIAQCMGRASEVSQGRQMPCHHSFKEARFVSMSSVIATQLPHATGLALAAKIRGDHVVVMGYLGDGATSEPDFHAALNFAAVKQAPVVFFCQNNQWAISVPVSKQTASRTIAIKAVAYGMPGVRVDGNDVLAVHAETKRAVDRARAGDGPTLIEALTYRRTGHSSSDDPTKYRSADEVKVWERRDPIDRMRSYLRDLGLLDQEKYAAMEERIHAAISEAILVAEAGPQPAPESLVQDVFAELTPQLTEQLEELKRSLTRPGAASIGHGGNAGSGGQSPTRH